ncbi:MAG: hypothetical protein CMM87_05745 [Rickettsiales bacterium]|nr:hypothetical protein [Rickettsiales bacterium]
MAPVRGHNARAEFVGGIGAARADAAGRARRLARAPGAARGGHTEDTSFIAILGKRADRQANRQAGASGTLVFSRQPRSPRPS